MINLNGNYRTASKVDRKSLNFFRCSIKTSPQAPEDPQPLLPNSSPKRNIQTLNMHSLPALALFLTALSSTAQAVANIALYPNPGCTGSGLVCLAIAPGACCSTASQVWASARITGSSVGDNRYGVLSFRINCEIK